MKGHTSKLSALERKKKKTREKSHLLALSVPMVSLSPSRHSLDNCSFERPQIAPYTTVMYFCQNCFWSTYLRTKNILPHSINSILSTVPGGICISLTVRSFFNSSLCSSSGAGCCTTIQAGGRGEQTTRSQKKKKL